MPIIQYLQSLTRSFLMTRIERAIALGQPSSAHTWGRHIKSELTVDQFAQWMKDYPSLSSVPCIVELFYYASHDTQNKVFEMVSSHRRERYFAAWANSIVREDFLVSLLRWHHTDTVDAVIDRYDPTFLTWVGLRFNQPDMYERFYPLCDHDRVRKMLDERVFEESELAYWDLEYYKTQRSTNLDTLARLQAVKIREALGDHGAGKRRKI